MNTIPSMPRRWFDYYFLERDSELAQLLKEHFGTVQRSVLFVLARSFDPRTTLGLQMLIAAGGEGRRDVRLLVYKEEDRPDNQKLMHRAQWNFEKITSLIKGKGKLNEHLVEFYSDGRRVASQRAADTFSRISEIEPYTDIIVDVSGMPRGVFFPLVARLLYFIDVEWNKSERDIPNLFLLVAEDPDLDAAITQQGIEEFADFLANFRGAFGQEAQANLPKIWIPILGEDRLIQLNRIYDLVKPDEICPVLPSPAKSPRRADNLIKEYYKFFFSEMGVDPRNLIFAAEQNPFEVYRTLRELALDVVYTTSSEEPIGRWAGGTCGNVLTILSFLGWSTYPVARLADNAPAALLCRDLASWGVHLEYITQERHGSTPVIVQHIQQDRGRGLHRFSFRCPICSSRLPGYRPVPASVIRHKLPSMPTPAVFFFDRASRGAVDMAVAFRRNGALIVFEPSTQRDQGLFGEALSVSHIVKVSHERWADRGELSPCEANWLLIETLGAEGLRFRSRLPSYHSSKWQHVPGFPVANYKDTAGAGDWCTAGMITCLGTQGAQGLEHVGKEEIRDALRQAQLLASWNCGFEGARGGMYVTQIERLNELALEIALNPSILRLANCRLRGSSLRGTQRDDVSKTEHRRELCHIP